MSISTMRNLICKFNRKPSILLAFIDVNKKEEILKAIDNDEFDIRIANNNYNISLFPINLIVTDEPNDSIMNTAYRLHCPVVMITQENKRTETTNNNLYISDKKNIQSTISSLLYRRFIIK